MDGPKKPEETDAPQKAEPKPAVELDPARWRTSSGYDVQRWLRDAIAYLSPSPDAYEALVKEYNAELTRSLDTLRLATGEDWLRRAAIQPQIVELETELGRLRRKADDAAKALLTEKATAAEKENHIQQLQSALKELSEKEALAHLLARVGEPAKKKLLESEAFRNEFNKDEARAAYVLSIDIRRSTELMLKAREPKLFAQFIITLASRMRQVIIDNFGVFDKFTGDGILAFFPDFYSGTDAGFFCLDAATKCHEVFTATYKEHRHCFMSVLADTGLGVGVDYGTVQVVQIGGDFTVVGAPVVYACRMAGCTGGETFVNEPAFEKLFAELSAYCDFDETILDIKREGKTVAHRARLNGKPYVPKSPEWLAAG